MENYHELKCIGRGSYGSAHLAVHIETKSKYVIKKVPVELLTEKEKQQAFSEASLLSKLKHPNVVEYKENFVENDVLHIVMAYCDGGDLAGKIQDRAMYLKQLQEQHQAQQQELLAATAAAAAASEGETNGQEQQQLVLSRHQQRLEELCAKAYFEKKQILDWFVQMAMAIKYLHEERILHRDLKTSNIFLTTENVVKLGDFGIAKTLESTLDQAKTLVGTPFYMSPEVCENKPYSYASDVWSLGCVLYEMCALKHAFNSKNILNLVMKIVQQDFDPLPKFCDDEMVDLLQRLLSKDPSARPSMEQIFMLPFIRRHMQGIVLSGGCFGAQAVQKPSATMRRLLRLKKQHGMKIRARSADDHLKRSPSKALTESAEEEEEECDTDAEVMLESSIEDEANVRLPERSTTPEPLESKASYPDYGHQSLELEAEEQLLTSSRSFEVEAEELMNVNYQNEYSEECLDSLQIDYCPSNRATASGRREKHHGRKLNKERGNSDNDRRRKKQEIAPAVCTSYGGSEGDVSGNDSESLLIQSLSIEMGKTSQHHVELNVPEPIEKSVIVHQLTEGVFELEDDDDDERDVALSESGILRELEMEAASSDANSDDRLYSSCSSVSEYEAEENYYVDASSDGYEEPGTECSDEFDDSEAEIIEYDGLDEEDELDEELTKGPSPATTTTSTSTAGTVSPTSQPRPNPLSLASAFAAPVMPLPSSRPLEPTAKDASSNSWLLSREEATPPAPPPPLFITCSPSRKKNRNPTGDVRLVMRNVARSLLESYEEFSSAPQ